MQWLNCKKKLKLRRPSKYFQSGKVKINEWRDKNGSLNYCNHLETTWEILRML